MTARDEAIEAAAARLLAAHQTRTPAPNLRDLLDGNDVEAAYAVQEQTTLHWLSQGRRLVGRKVGLTSRAVQKQLGVDQPDYGMLYADMAFADSEPIPIGRILQPRAETEIAFVLGRELPHADTTLNEVMSAVEYALVAIEVVGSRIENWDLSILDTIADNASSGVYVLGSQPHALSDVDPRLCGMVMERRGDPVSVGAGAACMGNPLAAVVWLARVMAQAGRPLQAGDLVLSGALGPMIPVVAGDVLDARVSGLGGVRAVFEEGT